MSSWAVSRGHGSDAQESKWDVNKWQVSGDLIGHPLEDVPANVPVTPDMIEAGYEAASENFFFCQEHPDPDEFRAALPKIFCAMLEAAGK